MFGSFADRMACAPRAVLAAAVALGAVLLCGPVHAGEGEIRRFLFGEGLTLVYDSRDQALAERLWPVLVQDRTEVMARLNLYPEGTLRVVLAPTADAFAEALGGFMPDALGLYFPATRTVVLRSPRTLAGNEKWDPRGVMRHELAHGILDLAIDQPIPRWLNEGLAILISDELNFLDESRLAFLAFRERLVPLRLLIERFPPGHGLELAYLEAASFVRFLLRRAGTAGIQSLVAGLAAGQSLDRAIALSYGESLERLEEHWREELSGRFSWWALVTPITLFGGLGAPLVVAAYVRRRLQARRRMREWEAEGEVSEPLAAEASPGSAPPVPLRPSLLGDHRRPWRWRRPPRATS
jgi:hypothetical protein